MWCSKLIALCFGDSCVEFQLVFVFCLVGGGGADWGLLKMRFLFGGTTRNPSKE